MEMPDIIAELDAWEASAALKPKRAKMVHHEDALHRSIWQFLKHALPHDAVAQSHENRGQAEYEQARRRARGCMPGWPDMSCHYRGMTIFIEIKVKGGTISPAQHAMHARLRAAGFLVFVCFSIEDVAKALAPHIPLKARV